MSYISYQWVKMNPSEAAARLIELERENAALRGLLSNIRDNKWDAFELASQIDEALYAARKEIK